MVGNLSKYLEFDQYQIENQLLGIRKQLEYATSKEQETQIRNRLKQIDLNKYQSFVEAVTSKESNDTNAFNGRIKELSWHDD